MANRKEKVKLLHYRGRLYQIPIYLGKQFRSFLYVSDWKVLPLAAMIAALVSMVIRSQYSVTMEGTIMSAFALACVAIWNGCFNSIQIVCRDRNIIKREHRSGMHITSYVFSHMVYQALLCLAQTVITMAVLKYTGVKISAHEGLFTPWMTLDMGISIFLITYTADMMSLLVSCLAHTTTAAMTVMPFLLIFQLIFGGGVFSLPSQAKFVTPFTISHYGLNLLAAQGEYNELPMRAAWDTLTKVENTEIEGDLTLGMVLDLLGEKDGPAKILREQETQIYTEEQKNEALRYIQEGTGEEWIKQGMAMALESYWPKETQSIKVGDVMDGILTMDQVQERRDESFHYKFKISEIIDGIGRQRVKTLLRDDAAQALRREEFTLSKENIAVNWLALSMIALFFACCSVIVLEFIDKDRR